MIVQRFSLPALAALVFTATPIGAQPLPPPKLQPVQPKKPAPPAIPAQPLTAAPLNFQPKLIDHSPHYVEWRGETSGVANEARMSPTEGSTGGALSSFKLEFENGDHQISRIGVMQEDGIVRAALNDEGGEDPFHAEASGVTIAGLAPRTLVSGVCGGRCTIPLPPAPSGTTAVLAGFWLERLDRVDANVKLIDISIHQERGTVDAVLLDDGGGRLNLSSGRFPPYRALVQVLFLPDRYIERTATIATEYLPGRDQFFTLTPVGGSPQVKTVADLSAEVNSPIALRSFRLRFNNGDHFVRTVAVTFARLGFAGAQVVEFHDANTDDPWSFSADFAILKRSL